MTQYDYSNFRACLSVAIETLRSLERECYFAAGKGATRQEIQDAAGISEETGQRLSAMRRQLDDDVKVGGSK